VVVTLQGCVGSSGHPHGTMLTLTLSHSLEHDGAQIDTNISVKFPQTK
jgi:hypothetical protein